MKNGLRQKNFESIKKINEQVIKNWNNYNQFNGFTKEHEDHICNAIDQWFFRIKPLIVEHAAIEDMKANLKRMILCDCKL